MIGEGTVSFQDLISHIQKLANDPDYQSPMKKLVDYRNMLPLSVSSEEIRLLTRKKDQLKKIFHGERCGFVVKRDLDYGLSRMHGARVESDFDTNVFRDLDQALEWLGVELTDEEIISI